MDFIDELVRLNGLETQEQWFSAIEKINDKYGFSRVLIGLLPKYDAELSSAMIVSNYPMAWRNRYDQSRYATIDPVVIYSFQNVRPVVWDESLYCTPRQREFREEASAYGLSRGITFPLHGPQGQFGTFSLAVDAQDIAGTSRHINAMIPKLSILKDVILQSALDSSSKLTGAKVISLTTREKEILKWCAVGKSSWDISRICGCSEANINYHFASINTKFGVASRRAAAVKAVSLGLISL